MKNLIKKLKLYTGFFFIGLAIVIIFTPAVYWFFNDHLTQIQLFKELWYIYPIIFLFLGVGLFILKDE